MIRQATLQDLESIARVHKICFPESYVTQLSKFKFLGGDQLPLFYKEFLEDNPELFVVAEDPQNGIVGFCMGYYMDKDHQIPNFMHKNRLAIAWKTFLLLISGNRYTWRKLFSRLIHRPDVSDWTIVNDKYERYGNDQRGDLLSVCVLPEFRGKNYAQEMMEFYLKSMKASGRKLCLLSVKQDNSRAIAYYERNGFVLYRTRGTVGYTFIKVL